MLCWLSDLDRWAEIIAHFLKPGGIFYVQDEHPFLNVFDDTADVTNLHTRYSYFHTKEPLRIEGLLSHSDPASNQHGVEYWSYSLSDILNALLSAGLRLEFLHEFPHGSNRRFPFMTQSEDGRWRWKDSTNDIPLTFSLHARKN